MVLSVSGRRIFKKCPHQWELKYITKIKGKPENERNYMAGSVIHEVIENWFAANRPDAVTFFSADRIRDTHRKFLKEHYVKWLRTETESSHLENTIEKALSVGEALKLIPFDDYGSVQVEAKVKGTIDHNDYWQLYGYIDLWFTESRAVYDFKITKDKRWFNFDQVLFYLYLVSVNTNKPHFKGGIIAPLLPDPIIEKVFTIEDFRKLREELKGEFDSIFKMLKSRREGGAGFPANRSDDNCMFCSYKNMGCKVWSLRALHHGIWSGRNGGVFANSEFHGTSKTVQRIEGVEGEHGEGIGGKET